MQLRRFTAETTPAALGAVRLALGDEAIILSNRKQGNLIEIIATGQMDDAATLSDMSVDDIQEELRSTAETLATSINVSQKESQRTTVASVQAETSSANASTNIEERIKASAADTQIDNSPRFAEPISARKNADTSQIVKPANTVELDAIVSSSTELLLAAFDRHARKTEDHFKNLTVNLWGMTSSVESDHLQKLLSLGIGAELSIELVEKTTAGASLDQALRQSYAKLRALLPIVIDKTSTVPGVTIVSGAPGSGKTTTLVKLAAEHVKSQGNQSVVFICTNTRRIGAFEELEAYGRLLGVPTVHAHDTQELGGLIEAFKHKQLVLIDHTLPNDEDSVVLPDCLLHPENSDVVRHVFVIPATTQALTIDNLIVNHCTADNISCVLTHLDSNARLGEVLSAIIRHQLPISYWSDSASVQQSLKKSDASVLIQTAAAMADSTRPTADDLMLKRLIQPSNATFSRNSSNVDSKISEEL